MSIPIRTSPTLQVGTPRRLFTIDTRVWSEFEVAPDGRFLAVRPEVVAREQPYTAVLNFFAELPR